MIAPRMACEIQPGDRINDHGVTLTVASAKEADWVNGGGRHHHGIEVITRQRGPRFPSRFALAEIVQVDRP